VKARPKVQLAEDDCVTELVHELFLAWQRMAQEGCRLVGGAEIQAVTLGGPVAVSVFLARKRRLRAVPGRTAGFDDARLLLRCADLIHEGEIIRGVSTSASRRHWTV
jgi:hypothetical protein